MSASQQSRNKELHERINTLEKRLEEQQELRRADCELDDVMLRAIKAQPDEVLPEAIDRVMEVLSVAQKMATEWRGRADDCGRLARAILGEVEEEEEEKS